MFSVIFIFGRYAIAPLILAFAITNCFLIKLTLPHLLFVSCLLFCLRYSTVMVSAGAVATTVVGRLLAPCC
jgi:hypothetical protein